VRWVSSSGAGCCSLMWVHGSSLMFADVSMQILIDVVHGGAV